MLCHSNMSQRSKAVPHTRTNINEYQTVEDKSQIPANTSTEELCPSVVVVVVVVVCIRSPN